MEESLPESVPPQPEGAESGHESSVLLTRALRTVGARAGVLLLSFGFVVAVARALDPASRGDFALLQALNGFTAIAANFAISGAVIYHVGKKILSLPAAAGAAASLAVLSGALASLAIIPIALGLAPQILPGIPDGLIIAAVAVASVLLMKEYLGGVMFAVGRPLRYVMAGGVQPLVAVILVTTLMVVRRASLTSVVGAWVLSIILSGLTALVLARHLAPGWSAVRPEHLLLLARFGIRTYPALVARFLNLRLDQFLVRALASASVLGQYAVAVNVGELLIRVPTQMVWAISGAISARDRERSADLVTQFCRWVLIVVILAVAALALAAPVAVPFIFGESYRPAAFSVLFLLPGMVFYAPSTIILEYFIVQRGQPGKAALIAAMSLAMSAILNFPLTPALGAVGASIASSVSYGIMFVAAVYLFSRDTGRSPWTLVPRPRSDFRAVWAAARASVPGRVPPSSPQV